MNDINNLIIQKTIDPFVDILIELDLNQGPTWIDVDNLVRLEYVGREPWRDGLDVHRFIIEHTFAFRMEILIEQDGECYKLDSFSGNECSTILFMNNINNISLIKH